ncbi:hypothetical protein QYF61_015800 [Mycteria americana]|uniref:Uncharacterized protein n=1 Tax=Mycteria americana TaxID=33587 RepID=A0AAN7N7J8_MYCAM|nr:hypothetical protein QYF61_015800 [Mycteria americana]
MANLIAFYNGERYQFRKQSTHWKVELPFRADRKLMKLSKGKFNVLPLKLKQKKQPKKTPEQNRSYTATG